MTSDRPVYVPGSIAVLKGSRFVPNEVVTLQVVHADGSPSSGAEHDPWTVVANGAGRFITTWHVCLDDCVGELLLLTADGTSSGWHAETTFGNDNECDTGVVVSVTPVGGACSAFTPAVGKGPDNFEVEEGGTYVMTIVGVTECSGDTITVFVQSSNTGNFCFNATGGGGTYVGTFTMPDPACHTMPISYKCGASAPCNNRDTIDASGPTSCKVHLRAANFDENCVLTGTDTNCGTPTGACCLEDGSCVEASEANCLEMGGTYQGDGSACVDVNCPPPPGGACCLPDGSCVESTEESCRAMDGTYQGDGSLCVDVNCPPPPSGACCMPDESCVEVTEEECTTLGGTYFGDASLCADVECTTPPSGACCLDASTCVEVTEDECTARGGTYFGDGSLCADVECTTPSGACCLDASTCVEVTEEQCKAKGGLYHGDFSLCADFDCAEDFPCGANFVLDFETDDMGNAMVHGTKVDTEYDGGPSFPSVTITGIVNDSGLNTAAILNSTTGPALQDPDLLVGKGNILILQTDANLNECPPGSGIYCSHNDDEDGGTLTFAFSVSARPSSIVLIDIDSSATSTVVLTDSNGNTRTYTAPAGWTGDLVTDGPPGFRTLLLDTTADQPGFASTATATEDAGFDQLDVVQIDVHLGGSGAVDDLEWCE